MVKYHRVKVHKILVPFKTNLKEKENKEEEIKIQPQGLSLLL